MKRIMVITVVLTAVSGWGQTVGVVSYIEDLQEALLNTGRITATDCHHVDIKVDRGWGYFKIPASVDKQTGGLNWMVLQNRTLKVSFDLAQVDEDSVKTYDVFDMDQDPAHGGWANVPLVMFDTKTLNGVLETDLDLDKLNASVAAGPPSNGNSRSLEGVTTRYGKGGMIWFSDRAHSEAFKKALQKAAIVCRAQ